VGEINLSNNKGRDAVVVADSVNSRQQVRWVDEEGRQAASIRVLKAPRSRDADLLTKEQGDLAAVSQMLIEGDPEVDFENTGRFLKDTSRVFVDPEGKVVHRVQRWEIVRNPDGSERSRQPKQIIVPNLAGESALKWSGVFIKKQDAIRRFVIVNKLQLVHINGLTYDFLFEMAKDLEAKDSVMLLGAGPKSNQPLILQRGGTPYRGFLEGRTSGEQYCLILHLSNLELKAPTEPQSCRFPSSTLPGLKLNWVFMVWAHPWRCPIPPSCHGCKIIAGG
jgi:hypothetical protein